MGSVRSRSENVEFVITILSVKNVTLSYPLQPKNHTKKNDNVQFVNAGYH